MKLKPKKEKFYAFNIGSNSSSKNKKKPDFSFKTLTGNFYEDIINSDLSIKRNKRTLSFIKNKTIKESIYSNRIIPKSWRTKLGYTDEVYKAIDQDPNFAYYLGYPNQKDNKMNEFFGTKLKNINHINNDNFNKEKNTRFISLENIDKYIKDHNINDKPELSERNYDNKKYSKTISFTEKNKDVKIMHHPWGINNNLNINKINDKLLSSKLDEYRTKYDIDKFVRDVKHRIKEIKIDDDEDDTITPNIIKNKKKNYYREFLRDMTQNNRENVLKKTIFSNLIPEKEEKKIFHKTYNNIKTIENYQDKKRSKFTPSKTLPFFGNKENNLNNGLINNKIKRDLELINYFGPHYYNCYVCKKRNIDFYANSSPKQTMILLNYLKKVKLNGNQDKILKRNKE